MKRFRSPLARVERWRAQEERQARRHLALALGELTRLEQRDAALRAGIGACRAEEGGRAGPLARALTASYEREQRALAPARAAAEQRLAQAQERYQKRHADRQAAQRVLEARREQWLAQGLAHEQRELEELARLAAARPAAGGS